MRPIELLRGVFLSFWTNKFRVFLTSLGIIIGTFTIIMVVGIGAASTAAVNEQYARLSVESITITRTTMRMTMGANGPTGQASLTKKQMTDMAEELENVRAVGISAGLSSEVAYNAESVTASIQGVNEDYAQITHLDLAVGDFFTDEDGELRNRYAVLGYNVAAALFGDDWEDCIGEHILIKGAQFTVTGVLSRVGGGGGSGTRESADDAAYIPYDVALKYTTGSAGTRGGGMAVSISSGAQTTFYALANDPQSVSAAVAEIKAYIEELLGANNGYSVQDVGSTLAAALETSDTMSALLIAVAAIVLIVSGIGIMNVLMVAVKERTREIGILKSIGAARSVILAEFLLEAVFISAIGGLLGVALSYYAPMVLAYSSISYLPSVQGLTLGFGFSVITGVFFGFYPAFTASKLKPIDALNAE